MTGAGSAAGIAFHRQSRRFALAASLAIAAIVMVIALTLGVLMLRWDVMARQTLWRLALSWSPTIFYLVSLWALRGLFVEFARWGLSFRPALTSALGRIGWGLVLGAATSLAVAPFILAATPPYWKAGFATLNVPALTLGLVGLAVLATARLVRRGMEIEAQVGALKSELQEFF